jgi:hypothetical protein
MMIKFIHSITREAYICLQMIILYGYNFMNGNTKILHMSSSYIMFCSQMEHVLQAMVRSMSTTFMSAINKCGYQVHFSTNTWVGITGGIIFGLYPLPDSLTAQKHRDFLDSVLLSLF